MNDIVPDHHTYVVVDHLGCEPCESHICWAVAQSLKSSSAWNDWEESLWRIHLDPWQQTYHPLCSKRKCAGICILQACYVNIQLIDHVYWSIFNYTYQNSFFTNSGMPLLPCWWPLLPFLLTGCFVTASWGFAIERALGSSIRKQSKDVWNTIVEEINKKKGGKDKERENISHRQRKREKRKGKDVVWN